MKTFTHEDIANLFNFKIDLDVNYDKALLKSTITVFHKDMFIFNTENRAKLRNKVRRGMTDGVYIKRDEIDRSKRLCGDNSEFYHNMIEWFNNNTQVKRMLDNIEDSYYSDIDGGAKVTVIKMILERVFEEEKRLFIEKGYDDF